MIVAFTGGRDFYDRAFVRSTLDTILKKYPEFTVVVGDCKTGADKYVTEWAQFFRPDNLEIFEAPWRYLGNGAGPVRNGRMVERILQEPERAVVAFPGNNGTADMTRQSREAGLTVWEPKP